MDKSTDAPSLAHIALQPSSQVTEREIEGTMVLCAFQFRCEEYRRRFEEDGIPISCDEAVNVYELLARLLAIDPDPKGESAERLDSISMGGIVSFQDGRLLFQEPAIRAIIEGFEREIAEDSTTLRIQYRGEVEPREVKPWDRFLVYQALTCFVEKISPLQNQLPREWLRLFKRAQAILAARTVNRPPGGPDPRLNVVRDSCVFGGLFMLQGCGLDVTSSKPRASLAAAMSKATGIRKSTIAKVWEDAAGVPALARPGKGSRNRTAVVTCMDCGAPVERARLREGLSHRCEACADARWRDDSEIPG
ncbi:MAG: hypothetical protein OXC08_18650 [Thiotrichales bacterium]|nr:hypothetical protein [Thiotrichales bacterium]